MGMEGARKNFVPATEMVQASGENSETLVYSPEEETRSVLKRVDQGTLKAIFDKMRVRSGTTEESDFVPFSKIQIDPTWCDMGRQDRTGIIINPVLIVETLGGHTRRFQNLPFTYAHSRGDACFGKKFGLHGSYQKLDRKEALRLSRKGKIPRFKRV